MERMSASQEVSCYNQPVLEHCLVLSWIELAVIATETLFVPFPNVWLLFGAAARSSMPATVLFSVRIQTFPFLCFSFFLNLTSSTCLS
jgi:hypothetical protein